LTARDGAPLSSDVLAKSYGTNPVVVRRLLSQLQEAGLVASQRGVGGGSLLAQPAQDISLRQVYEAVSEDTKILPRHRGSEGPVAGVLGAYIDRLWITAEEALLAQLEQVSIAAMDAEVRPEICALLDDLN
jgi:Rrf2 family protein